jgi:hypothetical protein
VVSQVLPEIVFARALFTKMAGVSMGPGTHSQQKQEPPPSKDSKSEKRKVQTSKMIWWDTVCKRGAFIRVLSQSLDPQEI